MSVPGWYGLSLAWRVGLLVVGFWVSVLAALILLGFAVRQIILACETAWEADDDGEDPA